MGRYAFFNTGVEYKFYFGVQPSEDIRTFGGVIDVEKFPAHKWGLSDMLTILEMLDSLREFLSIDSVDWSKYDKSTAGTYQLKSDLYKLYEENGCAEGIAKYILGCVIYHQLLYQSDLRASYEI